MNATMSATRSGNARFDRSNRGVETTSMPTDVALSAPTRTPETTDAAGATAGAGADTLPTGTNRLMMHAM